MPSPLMYIEYMFAVKLFVCCATDEEGSAELIRVRALSCIKTLAAPPFVDSAVRGAGFLVNPTKPPRLFDKIVRPAFDTVSLPPTWSLSARVLNMLRKRWVGGGCAT